MTFTLPEPPLRRRDALRTSTAVPTDPEALLRRREVAKALTAAGYPVAEATLATKATRGGGPPFRRFGRVPLYRWRDALAWAQEQLTPLLRNTSEAARMSNLPMEQK